MLSACPGTNRGKLLPQPCHPAGLRQQEQVSESSSQGPPLSLNAAGVSGGPAGKEAIALPVWHVPRARTEPRAG